MTLRVRPSPPFLESLEIWKSLIQNILRLSLWVPQSISAFVTGPCEAIQGEKVLNKESKNFALQTHHYSAHIDMFEGLVNSTQLLLSAQVLITLLRKRLTVITNMKRQQEDREFSKVPGLSATLDSYELFKNVSRSQ